MKVRDASDGFGCRTEVGLVAMHRRAWVLVAVVAAALTWAMAVPLGAAAVHTNADCKLCHGEDSLVSNALFEVGPVNRGTACRKCHLDSLVGAHPNHYAGGDCSAVCHRSWGPSLAVNTPTYAAPGGAFASAESQDAPAFVLHAIHTNPRWPADVTTQVSMCGSCHATASCTACHDSNPVPDPTHADHGDEPTSSPIVPWVGNISVGVTSSQLEDTMVRDASVRCGASGCHDTNGIALSSPQYMDVYAISNAELGYITPSISTSGTWTYLSGTQYSLQRERYSNGAGAQMTFTFTGERVAIYGTRDQYRGIAEVLVDSSSVATFSAYSAATQRQRPLWTSADLGPGQHTVTVRVTGAKEALARGAYVSVDHIAIYAQANDTIRPECISCHPTEGDDNHGGEHPVTLTFSHDVTETINTANTWDTGYGVYNCAQCHLSALRLEHRRPSTAGYAVYPDSCSVCHANANPTIEAVLSTRRTPAEPSWSGLFDVAQACSDPQFDSDCHSVNSDPTSRERHEFVVSQHAADSSGESPACAGCHGSDLRAAHNNPIPGNGKVDTNGCLACHGTDKLETNRTCSTGGPSCHSGGYGTVATHAIKDSGSHVASEAGKPFTSAYQLTSGTDAGGIECALCHSNQLIPAHSDAPAVGCASGGAGGKGCHLDTTYNSIAVAGSGWTSRKCADCHDYSVQQTHDSTMTPHLVANNGCAGTGSSCHNSNDLWVLHLTEQNGTPRADKGCNVIGCHDTLDRRPTKDYANSCGSTSPSGCHSAYTPTHVSNFNHTFSSVSYYNGASETGCTNQTGCHNSGASSTVDFGDDHHPVTGSLCFTSTCHTSPSKPAFTGLLPTDCQECHGGAFTGAPARNNLPAAPGSGGHYSETTHTAVGMTATLNAGGSASATCNNCHAPNVGGSSNGLMNQHSSISIGGSPYGTSLSCGECHGDTRAFGYAEVVANWTNNTCADCHTGLSSSPFDHASSVPAVAESGSSCGTTGAGCHNTTDLHALHKDASGGCGLTGCHNYSIQAHRPTAKGCGGATSCHTGYTNTSHGIYTNANDTTHTATSGMTSTITSGVASASCSTCHSAQLGSAHATTTVTSNLGSGHSAWTNLCTNCHNEDRAPTASASTQVKAPANWTNNACTDCHSPSYHNTYATGHTGTSTQGCGASGDGCHNTYDLALLHGKTKTNGCQVTGCHDAVNKPMASAAKSCGSGGACHTTYTASSHGGTVTGNETTHTASAMSTILDATYNAGGANACNNCHSAGLGNAHKDTSTTAVLKSGNQGWAGTAQATCSDCHNATSPDNAVASIKTDSWSPNTCDQCHVTRGNGKHQYYATNHVGVEAPGCTWDTACHGNTRDLRQLHNNSVTGNASTAGCDSAGCHDALDKPMTGATKTCGSGGSGCHTDKTHDNHGTATAHVFSASSAYDDATETGCMAQPGCHNQTGGDTSNFADPYHPNSGCTSGPCHTSPSKPVYAAAFNGDGTCMDCHNSNYTGAADRVPVNGAYPAGHYSETTHTAVGMTANVTAGGSASATCNNCHSPNIGTAGNGLANQHTSLTTPGDPYGSALSCGECHSDLLSRGLTEVQNNWTNDTCADCHAPATSTPLDHATTAPAVAETTTTCGSTGINCHNTTDLHALHKNASGGCNLTGCHNYTIQAHRPTAKSCGVGGACHTTYTSNTHTHTLGGGDAAKHQPTSSVPASDTSFYSTQCGLCHDMRTTQSSLTSEHALATSAKTLQPTNTCRNCHNNTASTTAVTNNWSTKDTAGTGASSSCGVCHQSGSLAIHVDASATAHVSASTGCANTGIGCHSNDLSSVGATATAANTVIHNSCLRCHSRTGSASWTSAMVGTGANLVYNPSVKSCGQATGCHTSTYYTTTTHRATLANPVTGNDATWHTATGMTSTITSGVASAACSACHSATLLAAHDPAKTTANLGSGHTAWSSTAGTTCQDCHNENRAPTANAATQVKSHWTNNLCTDCHSPSYHNTYATGHTGTSTQGCGASGVGCHNTYDLAALHGTTKTNGCQVTGCHDAVDKAMTSAAKSCGVGGACHTTYTSTSHGVYTNANDTTHTATSGMTSTITSGVASASCSTCHSAQLGSAHATTTITSNLGSGHSAWTNLCTNCHNEDRAPTASASTQVKHPTNWTNNACTDCHSPSYHNTYATGHTGTSTQGCGASGAGCHTTYDLARLHGQTKTNGCQVTGCHDAVNKPMASAAKSCGSGGACHTTYTASSHGGTVTGNETTHTATGMTTILDPTYNAGGANACNNCHSAGLGNAHKDTSTTANLHSANTTWNNTAQATCSDCHNATSPDNSVTTIKTNSWNLQTCDQCHVTNGNGKHALYASNHVGVESGCSSGSCHGTDLRAAHNNSVTSNASTAGCDSAGCHDSLDKDMTGKPKTCGATGACHTDKNTSHGAANHDAETSPFWNGSVTTTTTVNGIPYAPSINIGCGGTAPYNGASAYTCHFSDLVKEHGTAASGGAGRTMERNGVGCGVCHTDKGGTVGYEATDTVIANAITANDLRCETCHKSTTDAGTNNGVQMGHQTTSAIPTSTLSIGVARVGAGEFRSWKTAGGVECSGGHRVFNYLPNWPLGQGTTAIGTINGVNVGTGLDPLGTYTGKTNPRTGTTWVFGDVVLCEDCHWYNAAPNGPQGASVPFYVDGNSTRPTTHWYNGLGSSGSNPPAPCNKCHTTLNTSTHRSAHTIQCQACHVRIPHAWKRPRLMRRVTGGTIDGVAQDTEPYATTAQGDSMLSYKISANQTNFTTSGSCNTNCDSTDGQWPTFSGNGHEATTPYWP